VKSVETTCSQEDTDCTCTGCVKSDETPCSQGDDDCTCTQCVKIDEISCSQGDDGCTCTECMKTDETPCSFGDSDCTCTGTECENKCFNSETKENCLDELYEDCRLNTATEQDVGIELKTYYECECPEADITKGSNHVGVCASDYDTVDDTSQTNNNR
jgi:hypothetical protein